MAKPYSTARTLQKRTERTRERVQAWQTQCPAGHPTIPAVRLELLKFLPGGPKREAKHSLHTPVGVTFLQGPQFRMGAAGAPRRMCCQVRCPSLRTRPEQGRAQLRDQEITTHARLSSHAMHRSQPSQGSSDHLEASVGLRLRSLPLEPGQDRTKPSKAMFVKKCNDRKNIYTMPRRKGRVQNYGLCMHVFCGVFSSLHLLVYCGKD